MSIQYATASELADYSPDLDHPDAVTDYLRAASELVSDATGRAFYVTDSSGAATDVSVIGAFRDAVCQQVTDWVRAGVDPTLGTVVDAGVSSRTTTAGPRTVTEQYTTAGTTVTISTDELTPRAWRILRRAGLVSGALTATYGGMW